MRLATLLLPFGMLCAMPALAQVAQVAPGGAILRQLQEAPAPLPEAKAAAGQDKDRPPPPAGPPVHVTAFRFEGNRLIGSAGLQALLARFTGRDLLPVQFRQVTDVVAQEYRRRGWLARAVVPPQTVTGGVVLLQVIEGRVGEVGFADDTDVDALRVKPQIILDRVQAGQQGGQPVNLPALERGVLLAGDLPGVSVTDTEQAGQGDGETDIALHVRNQPLVMGAVALDNYGQAGVGSERVVGHVDVNSLLGRGEQLDLIGIVTPDLQYGRGQVAWPLTASGLRLEIDGAALHYAVAVPDYEALHLHGNSTVLGGRLDYPVLRATDHNLTVGLDLRHKWFEGADLWQPVGDYDIYDAGVFVTGNVYDGLLGGAISTAELDFGRGWVAMAGSPGEYWDRTGPDTQGQFNVLRWRLDRTQQLPAQLSLYAAFSGQLSYQNLDPAEMFYPGGPNGVGSSAVAADGASSGQMADLELRWAGLRVSGVQATLNLRFDAAHVRLYANDQWPEVPSPNSYFLQGLGGGARFELPWNLRLSIEAVHRVGGDAGARAPDNGLSGARRGTRVWASLEMGL